MFESLCLSLTCHVNLLDEPEEDRPGVAGQFVTHPSVQLGQVDQPLWVRDGGHTSPALGPGDLHAVHHAVPQPDHLGDHGLHLGSADVLPLPSEGVAGSVLEVEPAELIHHEDVPGPEESVALPPDVPHDLLVAAGVVSVAVVVSHRVAAVYPPHQLPGLPVLTGLRQPGGISHRLPVFVHLDDAQW